MRKRFVSLIDQRLASTAGAIVQMEANKPQLLPEVLWEVARIAGCQQVDQQMDEQEEAVEATEADHSEVEPEVDFYTMTKKELEDYGREKGIELDRRHNKGDLIEQLKDFLRSN